MNKGLHLFLIKKFEVLIYLILIMSFSIWYISLKKDDNFFIF